MRGYLKRMGVAIASVFLVAGAAVAGGYGHSRGHFAYKHYPSHRHHRHHNGDVGLALGLGVLFGTVLGHALHEPHHPRYRYYPYDPPPRAYRRYRYPRRYYDYRPPRVEYRVYRRSEAPRCLQEREYQTTVIIDGREIEAYGTACLQADGSWRRGAANLVPE